jgi:hypothetical protein
MKTKAFIMDPEIRTGRGPGIRYTYRMMRKQYTAAFKAKVVQELLKEEKGLAKTRLRVRGSSHTVKELEVYSNRRLGKPL